MFRLSRLTFVGAVALCAAFVSVHAQDRLRTLPGYEQFQKMQVAMQGGPAVISGAVNPTWAPDSRSFTYSTAGKAYKYDLTTMRAEETGDAPVAAGGGRPGGAGRAGGGPPAGGRAGGLGAGGAGSPGASTNPCPQERPERGRQAACQGSPDGTMKAYYRDRNIYVSNADGTGEVAITTDGSVQARIKYGVGSWVYGEELGQTTAIWWSPDSKKVAFYRFDESKVKDYYIQMEQTQLQVSLDTEAYPKAGTDNPVADVMVYDLASKKKTTLDTRDGKPLTNDAVGYYVYGMTPLTAFSPDGTEMLMNRTNRRQNIMEYIGCNPTTGKCRVIVREEWPTGWVENKPALRWMADKKRFIWESERTGWQNYYLYDLASAKLINPITTATNYEAASILKVDEAAGVMFYMGRDGDNYLKMQLHRVGLDGKGDVRLTDPKFNHTVSLSPDNKFFTDVYQTHDQPPATQLVDMTGKVVAQLAKSDLTKFNALGLKKVEMFTFKAADGVTTLYGTIAFPSNFDPAKKYPTLMSVYGGPASGSNVPTETFTMSPNVGQLGPMAEYGFLLVNLNSRAAPGQGKKVLDSIYLKLGVTEMDDMAEGIKSLWNRPYFDKARVGIYGTSYGGYTSALEILRHPEVFTAASASSPVTAWYHYDTIYTERYMWIPQENKEGYEAGNAMNFAKNLKGRLLLYYGTADNNVHPNNSMQLIKALQAAGKSFEIQVGPDAGHSGVNGARMMEFFIENLIQHPERLVGG